MASRSTSMARPASSRSRASSGKSSSCTEIRWLGTTPAVRSNQNLERPVRTRPLSGIGVGMITSNAEIRSDATSSMRSPKLYSSRTLPEASCRSSSFSDTRGSQSLHGAVEDLVHVAKHVLQVEGAVERTLVQQLGGLGIGLEQAPDRHLLVPGPQSVSLDDLVGALALQPRVHQRKQGAAREDEPVRGVHVAE